MAHTEADRDDLFAEAVALVRRAEHVVPGLPDEQNPVVAGLHLNGRVSVYCGGTVADHFDPAGRLARAFRTDAEGTPRLYRSQGDTLAELVRRRSETGTTLVRRDLGPGELAAFLAATRARLAVLAAGLAGPEASRRVAGEDPSSDLSAFFAVALPADGPLAPRFKGKR
ncbi:hypothetical protein [Alienimonas californiensis]|uniref:Uncharacterized protein n=1 Tax=Alienimonas californiensis TaxID=2527989 RepID=A0A517P3K6_9PLAN|nr:hypothetical protein [Alienimonas californiensis]QDT13951.1 hypothetical protein CA12_00190 [Alienimonas californiensis]